MSLPAAAYQNTMCLAASTEKETQHCAGLIILHQRMQLPLLSIPKDVTLVK
jgi:hypothetical protein